MLFCDKSGCREEFAKDPCVVKFNERYYLSYSIWFMDNDTKMYLFYQGSPDGGEHWYLSKCAFEMVNDLPKIIR